MRIATNTLYQNSVDTMANQQSSLVDLQNQISSGKRVSTASDDPQAAAQTVRVTQSKEKLAQYSGNLSSARTTLQLEDGTLSNVTNLIQQAQSIVVGSGNATLDRTTRAAMATKIDSIRDQLLQAANTTDSQGNHVFGGFETNTPPYSIDEKGKGIYTGSQGQRSVQVTDSRAMAVGEIGSKIFQRVTAGASKVAMAGPNNSGSGIYTPISTTDASAPHYDDDYTLTFKTGKDGSLTYSVRNASMDAASGGDGTHGHGDDSHIVIKDQPYQPGAVIRFAGQSMGVSGHPADGDVMTIGPAQSAGVDVFENLTRVAQALRTADTGTIGDAKLANQMSTAGVQLSNSLDNVLTVQASVGAREQEADALTSQNTDSNVQYQTQLSDLTASDFVSAYSQFSQVQTSLQAAEKTFMQVQNLSLFDLIK